MGARGWNAGDGWRRKTAGALLLQVTPDLPNRAEYEARGGSWDHLARR